MNHKQVYDAFRDIFPAQVGADTMWFPNGKNGIRLRRLIGMHSCMIDYIFTYHGPFDWRLETIDSFIAHLKERK